MAWQGQAWHGMPRLGEARQGMEPSQVVKLTANLKKHLRMFFQLGMAWRGQARLGRARHGMARRGEARRGKDGSGRAFARLGTATQL